jgi:hypothetical protein
MWRAPFQPYTDDIDVQGNRSIGRLLDYSVSRQTVVVRLISRTAAANLSAERSGGRPGSR